MYHVDEYTAVTCCMLCILYYSFICFIDSVMPDDTVDQTNLHSSPVHSGQSEQESVDKQATNGESYFKIGFCIVVSKQNV